MTKSLCGKLYLSITLLLGMIFIAAAYSIYAVNKLEVPNPAQTEMSTSTTTSLIMLFIILFSLAISATITIIMRNIASQITNSTEELKKLGLSSNTIGKSLQLSSESLSSSITKQAASVHETSAAINEITSMINRTSENAKASMEVAQESSKKAEEGEKIMIRMVAAMETIQDSSTQLQNIANIIAQINAKTTVINDIVSKTELLSLNASIESARAGEHGKGFAVVAEEVGNLAKVSGKSAMDIQALIQSSQEQVNQIIQSTKSRVDDGKIVTNEAQETFQKISENIVNMSSVIEQISQATKEQEIGIRQISHSMTDIDKTTKDNQATVVTNSEIANKLAEQSIRISESTKIIEKNVSGI